MYSTVQETMFSDTNPSDGDRDRNDLDDEQGDESTPR